MAFSVNEFRKKFPQLESQVNGHRLVYFDNGASTLKHTDVTERVNAYNRFEVSNVHRGSHSLSQKGTEAYEEARKKVQKFINASSDREIIFTRGTTESVNLVSQSLGP
ncbi:MAG: aminotransferase class V-fold PLP-dependent enzyme, partial [Bdellovibrionales bacterium]|nr:aminotransferase class V-fold PLP-dependent enzyme [Bdellovibrionales bacterium]NQZ19879.1 aminotransferase class V-fold PLP-dependent enzyme [Bdellovibrionales bacterium]